LKNNNLCYTGIMAELTKNDLKNIKEVFTEALEPLVQIFREGFLQINKHLDNIDQRLDSIDKRSDFIKVKLGKVK